MNATIRFDATEAAWIGEAHGRKVVKSYDKTRVIKMMAKGGYTPTIIDENTVAVQSVDEQWPINQRFEFVTQLVTMIAERRAVSAIITGPGGLGKTHTVRAALEDYGLEDQGIDEGEGKRHTYRMIKGYSTAKGLYRQLYENRNSVMVFDDCDSVLKDPVALNLLKAALDSYDKRVISWNAEMKDDSLPKSFQFDGRVIFISNVKRDSIDNALRTRSYCVDLSMTTEQKIERMAMIAAEDTFMPDIPMQYKEDAIELIVQHGDRVKELSLRTLQAILRIRNTGGNWSALATYVLMN